MSGDTIAAIYIMIFGLAVFVMLYFMVALSIKQFWVPFFKKPSKKKQSTDKSQ